jgi:hypothetical protein
MRKTLTTRSLQRTGKGEFTGGGFRVTTARVDGLNMVAVELEDATYSWETFDIDTFDEQRARLAAEVGFRTHFGLQNGGPADYGQRALTELRRRREERV